MTQVDHKAEGMNPCVMCGQEMDTVTIGYGRTPYTVACPNCGYQPSWMDEISGPVKNAVDEWNLFNPVMPARFQVVAFKCDQCRNPERYDDYKERICRITLEPDGRYEEQMPPGCPAKDEYGESPTPDWFPIIECMNCNTLACDLMTMQSFGCECGGWKERSYKTCEFFEKGNMADDASPQTQDRCNHPDFPHKDKIIGEVHEGEECQDCPLRPKEWTDHTDPFPEARRYATLDDRGRW